MEILNKKDFISALKLGKFKCFAGVLMRVISLRKLNKAYARAYSENGLDFIQKAFKEFGFTHKVDEKELENIPKEGAFITVSNHPFGGIDGLMLIKTMAERRADFKIMANFLLERIAPIKDYLLIVNPFEELKEKKSSFQGIKHAIQHLNNNAPIGIFPAGEVSTYHNGSVEPIDKAWQSTIMRIIMQAKVPVVPVFFAGTNSKTFHLLGKIHPRLRTVYLIRELFNKKGQTLHMRIGKPISVKELESFENRQDLSAFLRAKTYSLGASLTRNNGRISPNMPRKKAKKIPEAISKEVLTQEIDQLPKECLVQHEGKFSLYITPHNHIPNVLYELGRIREITFRQAGEGTNKKVDIDKYDRYYHQLFIWDNQAHRLVGGYRIGIGKEIMDCYGIEGFYINSLFKIDKAFYPYLEKSIELGRSFIVKEYQKSPLPLLLLWRGIWSYLDSNPSYLYMIGPVSISNKMSSFSKSMLVQYIQTYYFDNELAQYINARNSFEPNFGTVNPDIVLEKVGDNLNLFDKYIEEVEASKMKLPVLLKKYLKQNAKILGFNIDPKFNNALDGLLFLVYNDMPKSMIMRLKKDL